MTIDKFDSNDIKQTQALTKKYCMPMDHKKFIKWRGTFKRKGYGKVTIETDTRRYLAQICGIYFAENHKGFTLEDIVTICQLRYMGARSSLRNAKKNEDRLPDYPVVRILLTRIMADCDAFYRDAMAAINKKNRAFFKSIGIILAD